MRRRAAMGRLSRPVVTQKGGILPEAGLRASGART
jgi:hypothetical protein